MGKTWKDQPRNVIAKDLRTPKYRKRVIPDKREKVTEAEMLEAVTRWDDVRNMFKDGYAED